ncbi:MAG TPA: HAMP domain-containing sensor histidine kinase [Thermoanaerobaculia bacterium]|jgi:signal transduction histidine kinase
MSERTLRGAWHRSIFVKLLAIMLATAVSLVFFVAGFFAFFLGPNMSMSSGLFVEYARTLADSGPDLRTATRIAERLDLQIRYEGPEGSWETAPGLPSLRELAAGHGRRRDLIVAPGPRGGTYLIAWPSVQRLHTAHNRLLWLLHVMMAGIILAAYLTLRHSLRPLRALHDGVARLSEGELDVVVPSRTRDEFGALAAAFNQMVRRISEMIRARDQLLLDVSHELRSPLTRMKVALELLPAGDKRQRIAADVAEMEAMITELLELERLREGRGLRRERRDLVPLLREVTESFQDRSPGARFVTTAAEIQAEVDGDKIRAVLRNLLENAVKYSLSDNLPIVVAVQEDEGEITIRVTDDGPGIPEADLANLFEPFYRVDRSRSKKSGGYGLGLSICKRIVEAHGGSIVAANDIPRGATFTLTLPKSP